MYFIRLGIYLIWLTKYFFSVQFIILNLILLLPEDELIADCALSSLLGRILEGLVNSRRYVVIKMTGIINCMRIVILAERKVRRPA